MTRTVANKDSALFFADLEQQAGSYPVRSVKITAKDRSLLGLFLMDDDAEATEVEAALTRLACSFNGKDGATLVDKLNPTAGTISEPGQLKKILRAELDRVQLTRLPCSLLLLATESNGNETAKIAEAIKECLHHVDILIRRDNHQFAVILPGTNLGKAILRAKTIRKATLATGATRLGIALCYANDRFSPDDLLAHAEAELARTLDAGAEPICHVSGIRAEDACQVSVEERAQLFGFLVKDTN